MRWLIFSWLLRPLLAAVAFVVLYRARVTDPDRRDVVRPLAVFLGLVALAFVLLVITFSAVGVAISGGQGADPAFPAILGALIGLICFVLVVRIAVRRARDVPIAGGRKAIRLAHYVEAPSGVRKSVRRILRSARALRRERACASGIIDEKELQHLVYSSVQQAVLCSELNASVSDLRNSEKLADREAISAAEQRMSEIRQYLKDVEQKLGKAVASARGISQAIAVPEQEIRREREKAESAAADELRHKQARERMNNATVAVPPPISDDVVAFEEKVAALDFGYRQAQNISEQTLRGPTLPDPPDILVAQEEHANGELDLRKEAGEVAKVAARWIGGASRSAVKKGVKKLRERMERDG